MVEAELPDSAERDYQCAMRFIEWEPFEVDRLACERHREAIEMGRELLQVDGYEQTNVMSN